MHITVGGEGADTAITAASECGAKIEPIQSIGSDAKHEAVTAASENQHLSKHYYNLTKMIGKGTYSSVYLSAAPTASTKSDEKDSSNSTQAKKPKSFALKII